MPNSIKHDQHYKDTNYSFKYIKYRWINICIIPICIAICLMPDIFGYVSNNVVYFLVNIIIIIGIINIFNYFSNKYFQSNANTYICSPIIHISLDDKHTEVYIDDIEQMILMRASRWGNKYLKFIIKQSNKPTIKILTPHLDDILEIDEHILSSIFQDIQGLNTNLCFDEGASSKRFWIANVKK